MQGHTEQTEELVRQTDPQAILAASWFTPEEKRAVLASWASDIHAVRNKPALRELEDGTILEVDAILDALKALDRVQQGATPA
jgi:hypothetical protein